MARVVIVGGGFSGAAAAVQLVRRSARPLAVTVVEPRDALGHGLAYSATDPDHRLNVPAERHAIDPDDPGAFPRWLDATGVLRDDPEARLPDGRVFARRRDFGRFVAETVRACRQMPGGSTIGHRRARAVDAASGGTGWQVHLDDGTVLPADLLLLATGNVPPRLPPFVTPRAAAWRSVVANPLDGTRVRDAVAPDDRVGMLGSGLTALDLLTTLLRRGHRGPITVLSRHGLWPHAQPHTNVLAALRTPHAPFDPPGGPLPDFVAALGPVPRLRPLMRALRRQVQADAGAGLPWQRAFGALRDSVWRVWPAVPEGDKRQFLRHVRTWYDVHRFLSPPQNEAIVRAAIRTGQVRLQAARVRVIDLAPDGRGLAISASARGHGEAFVTPVDALVNCTGVDGSATGGGNTVLQKLLLEGWLTPGPAGWGLAVDPDGRAIGRDGFARDTLRVIGPPATGVCGDTVGAGFIANHLRRAMPGMLAAVHLD